MNIKSLYNNLQEITLESYLNKHGIFDIQEFINPTGKYIDNPLDYEHINEAIIWLEHVRQNPNAIIGLIQDPDADGIMSSALAYMFLNHIGIPKENIMVFFHPHKTHGLTDFMMSNIISTQCQYLWICDAGVNDAEQCCFLRDMGVDILITDHHVQGVENNSAIIINHCNSPNIKNKHLCGTGVTFQLIRAYCEKYNDNWYQNKLDIVAIANIADVMSMANYENRWINAWGLKYITNPFLRAMRTAFIREDKVTPKHIAFNIAPKLNALCRGDDQELKRKVFMALCGEVDDIDSVVDELRKCHNQQTREVKAIYTDLLDHEPYMANNIIIERLTESTPYTGLIATKLSDHYSRPVILVHEKNHTFTGSCRSPVDFRQYLIDSNAINFAQGHDKAFGVAFHRNDVGDLIRYFENHPLPIEPTQNVTCAVDNVLQIPTTLYDLSVYDELWGHNIPAPNVYVGDITIKGTDIKELGGNTIKFKIGMVDFVKFACSNEFKEELGVGENKWIKLNVIGEPQYNVWNGRTSRQIIVDKMEIE